VGKARQYWTDVTFLVDKITRPKKPYARIKYQLKDQQGEKIKGLLNRDQIKLVPQIPEEAVNQQSHSGSKIDPPEAGEPEPVPVQAPEPVPAPVVKKTIIKKRKKKTLPESRADHEIRRPQPPQTVEAPKMIGKTPVRKRRCK